MEFKSGKNLNEEEPLNLTRNVKSRIARTILAYNLGQLIVNPFLTKLPKNSKFAHAIGHTLLKTKSKFTTHNIGYN